MDRDEGFGAGVPAADAAADTVLTALAAIRSSIDVVVAAAGGWRSDALARDGVREGSVFCRRCMQHGWAWSQTLIAVRKPCRGRGRAPWVRRSCGPGCGAR